MAEIHYLGHSSFLVDHKDGTILIDPLCNKAKTSMKKNGKLASTKKKFKGTSLILITNETPENFDKKTVQDIALENNAVVVGSDIVLNELQLPRHLKTTIRQKSVNLRNVKITPVPAHYPKSFFPTGYLIDVDGKRIYHSGTTSLFNTFVEKNIDIALLPIGGKLRMDVVDAVRATKIIKPSKVIPMQYNIFKGHEANPKDFKERIEKSVLDTHPLILTPGQKTKV